MTAPAGHLLTAENRETFVQALAETGNISESCRQIGFSRSIVYAHREQNSEFAAGWDEALDVATDSLEAEVRRRGHDGYEEPVFYQGVMVATIRKYSDTLLIFLLKKHNPAFRDHTSINLGGQRDNPMKVAPIKDDHLTDEERAEFKRLKNKVLMGGVDG